MTREPSGVLCVDKPGEITSFGVVAKLRGMAKTRRAGHAGTLDPFATGVLPVFFGRAAKAIELLPSHDKTYRATFALGAESSSYDRTGEILALRDFSHITRAEVAMALAGFVGDGVQLPPMVSAVRVGGRRLYELARQGVEAERTPRQITVYSAELLEADEPRGIYEARIICTKGTYIRTICHDLGAALGCGAVVTALRREEACGFTLGDCITLERAQELADENRLWNAMLPLEAIFAGLGRIILNEKLARHFGNGVELWLSQLGEIPAGRLAVFNEENILLGLASPDREAGQLRILKLF